MLKPIILTYRIRICPFEYRGSSAEEQTSEDNLIGYVSICLTSLLTLTDIVEMEHRNKTGSKSGTLMDIEIPKILRLDRETKRYVIMLLISKVL